MTAGGGAVLGQRRLPGGKSTGEAAIAKWDIDTQRSKRGEVFVVEEERRGAAFFTADGPADFCK